MFILNGVCECHNTCQIFAYFCYGLSNAVSIMCNLFPLRLSPGNPTYRLITSSQVAQRRRFQFDLFETDIAVCLSNATGLKMT